MAPAVAIAVRAAFGDLGANPIETLEHETGAWAIRLLFATLAITPLRRITGWQRVAQFRRRIGLAAFGYVCVHFSLWAGFDNGLDIAAIGEDILERPYVTAGFAAFTLLVPLAVTSTRGWGRRLGRRWITLHRLVYLAAVLAVVHFWWLVKKDVTAPAIHAALLAALLAARFLTRRARRASASHRA